MNRKEDEPHYVRIIYKTPEFEEFYIALPAKTQGKFDFVMNVISTIYTIPSKFVKHLENTDLYEMRVSVGTNEYRTVIFAIDNDNIIEAKNIIFLNAFLKKDKKDYRKQVEKAMSILNNLEL